VSTELSAQTIIVGSGAAGAVIAARSTERNGRDVLVLEAGPDYPSELPADLEDGRQNSLRAHDWGYRHRPTRDQALFLFPRGRVVGGSSAVNTCIALRGNPYDYDEWGSLGLDEWSWEKCLPAFKRLERDLDFGDADYHGSDGPIPIRRHPIEELRPFQRAFLDVAHELGFARCADSNAPNRAGAGPHAMNKVGGRRMSAARCYLDEKVRARIRLRASTHVRRVLFDNRRVCGVEVERDGNVETITAERVLLCGGAIGSLGILLRSGVGPAREIERLGVELVRDNPHVGARLLDHPGAAMVLLPKFDHVGRNDPALQTVLRYSSRDGEFPTDMQLQPGSNFPFPDVTVPLTSMMCCVGKPSGTGTIRFPSADPHARPLIDSSFLLDRKDLKKAVEAMELASLFVSAKPMNELVDFFWPRRQTFATRARIEQWILKSCGSGYHPCGTIPMGSAVDQHGRVEGVTGLVVADASIMPTIPSSNTHLPTLMIGERIGAWLRDGLYD
jgi:choline dehydrogenase